MLNFESKKLSIDKIDVFVLDSSYFSDMLEFYPPEIKDFEFVWEKLEELITAKKIILLDKFFSEIKDIKAEGKNPPFVKKFIDKNQRHKEKSDINFYLKVQSKYEDHKETLSGNFDSVFDDSKADGFLIAHALKLDSTNENLNIAILTSEKLQSQKSKDSKQRLNIPSLAKKCEIDCFDLNDSIRKLLA